MERFTKTLEQNNPEHNYVKLHDAIWQICYSLSSPDDMNSETCQIQSQSCDFNPSPVPITSPQRALHHPPSTQPGVQPVSAQKNRTCDWKSRVQNRTDGSRVATWKRTKQNQNHTEIHEKIQKHAAKNRKQHIINYINDGLRRWDLQN